MYLTIKQAKEKILKDKYNGVPCEDYFNDCKRIDNYEPWEYVLGFTDFLDCKIDLSDRPMVPREETAFWVKRVIEEWKDKKDISALDLYAGSGNIGLALYKHLDGAEVTLNEIDNNLLKQIEKSIELNNFDRNRFTLISGDSFEKVEGKFDIICANPPYVDPSGESQMDKEMYYEPRIAFFGSSDGYGQHREIIKNGRKYLTDRGVLYVEFDMTQAEEIKRMLNDSENGWGGKYEIWNDPYGNEGIMVLYN